MDKRRKYLSGAADWTTQAEFDQGMTLLVNRAKLTDLTLRAFVADALQRIMSGAFANGTVQKPNTQQKSFADFLVLGEYDVADKMSEEAADALAAAAGVTRDQLESGIVANKQQSMQLMAPVAAHPQPLPQPSVLMPTQTIYVPPATPQPTPVPAQTPAAPAPSPGMPWWLVAGLAAGALWLFMPAKDAADLEEEEGDEDGFEGDASEYAEDSDGENPDEDEQEDDDGEAEGDEDVGADEDEDEEDDEDGDFSESA